MAPRQAQAGPHSRAGVLAVCDCFRATSDLILQAVWLDKGDPHKHSDADHPQKKHLSALWESLFATAEPPHHHCATVGVLIR